MRKYFIAALAAATVFISQGTEQPATACSNNPCVHHAPAPPKVVYKTKTVYVYVTEGEEAPPPVVIKKAVRKKKPAVQAESDCEFVKFSHGYASQPVLFFANSADARCQKEKTFCRDCTDWIHGLRGPVYGPAARMKGGRSKAFAPPAGIGAWVPRHNKGLIAYCDQAVGNDTYSWLFKR